MRWSTRIEVAETAALSPDNDALFDLLEFLAPFDASVTGTPEEPTDGKSRYGARMVVEADTPADAVERATKEFFTGIEKVGLPRWPLASVTIMTEEELELEVAQANFPELVGVTELAGMLGVTRQRASALAKGAAFPRPLAVLHGGPVWTMPSVRRFVETWERKPGRPSKQRTNAFARDEAPPSVRTPQGEKASSRSVAAKTTKISAAAKSAKKKAAARSEKV